MDMTMSSQHRIMASQWFTRRRAVVTTDIENHERNKKMFGTVIAAAVGSLSFKLGMDAAKMRSGGKSTKEIIASMPMKAYSNVAGFTAVCYRYVRGIFRSEKIK